MVHVCNRVVEEEAEESHCVVGYEVYVKYAWTVCYQEDKAEHLDLFACVGQIVMTFTFGHSTPCLCSPWPVHGFSHSDYVK